MPRRGLFLLWGAVLLAGAAGAPQGDDGASSVGISPPLHDTVPDDTVYVAEVDSVVVVYYRDLDTLIVRSAKEVEPSSLAVVAPADTGSAEAANLATEPPHTESDSSSSSPSKAPSEEQSSSPSTPGSGPKEGISISGLVIDRTHSIIGRDFKDAFHNHWTPPEDVTDYTIEIREQPLPQFGSRLSVRVGETTIYRGQLRPQYRQIEQAARRAAARARYYLTEFYEPREVY